ncbi:MAG: BlaI/MecI/CopY family transcriptional regulator [Candidatus Brocadiia bacterium]
MGRRKSRTLTDVELEFMRVLWDEGEATTQDVQHSLEEQGRRLSGGSIRKMLSILVEKGYAARRKDGRAYLYRPTVPERRAHRNMVRDLLRRAFDGSASLMVAALLDASAASEDELDEIKRLIEEHE